MSANINGKGRVFATEHEGWTSYVLGISNKNREGQWVKAYQPVRFRKGVSVPNGTDIEFKAFATVKERTVDGQNRNYVVWQILEFTTEQEDFSTEYTALQEEEMPF